MDNLLDEVQHILRGILDQPKLVLTRDSNAESVADWDSLAHVNLLTALERRYKIKIPLIELESLHNVGDIVDLLRLKLAR